MIELIIDIEILKETILYLAPFLESRKFFRFSFQNVFIRIVIVQIKKHEWLMSGR